MTDITQKAKDFNKVLVSAKKALDSIGMKFHLHAGTSLGAYREHSFIEHDHDIDIAVFYKDANT
jgi:phosphorylcholine metabolism protein LicD